MQAQEGVIYQSISGFYYVWSEGESYATKPKGLFRHTKEKPLVGDRVVIEIDHDDEHSESRLVEILERKNELIRPSISNVDYALIVTSLVEPSFSYSLLDNFLVAIESNGILPIIILTKYDLLLESEGESHAQKIVAEITAVYTQIGYQVVLIDGQDEGFNRLSNLITKGIYVVMGQSGVGKSTLLNRLLPDAEIETNAISQALNRGKHTTREVTLYPFNEGFLADTPGFSAIEFPHIEKEELRFAYPEIRKFGEQCQFRSCLHLKEPKCAVKQAVEAGLIAESRYTNYTQNIEKIEQRKPIYHKKNR